MPTMECLEFWR